MTDRPDEEGLLERLGLKSRVGRRLLGWALVIGVAASLVASVTSALISYGQRLDFLEAHLKSTGEFAVPALVHSAWAFDDEQTRLQLDGLARLAEITTVRLRQKDQPELIFGESALSANRLERTFELVHAQDGKRHDVGTLTLITDLRGEQASAIQQGAISLAGNAFVIFSVLAILSLVYHALVTRRLLATAGDLRHVTADDLRQVAARPAAPPRSIGRDELDELTDAVVTLKLTGSQALREADERHAQLRQLMDTVPDLVWLKDPDGVYLSCNKGFERLYGALEADIIGKTDHDFVSPELAAFFRRNDLAAANASRPTVNEEWLSFADGSYRGLFETTKTPVVMRDGSLRGVLGIAHDITQRTTDHDRVRASEARFRAIFEGAQDGMLLTDVETKRVLDANPNLCAMVGYQRDELLSMGQDDLYPEADRDRVADTFDRQARGELGPAQTLAVVRKDGSVFSADISVAPFELDGRHYLAGFFRDISERQRTELALERHRHDLEALVEERTAALAGRERHLEVILNGIPGMVGYWDCQQINRFANSAYRDWLGVRPEQIEGKTLREVVGTERYESIHPLIEGVLRGEPQSFERVYPRPGDPQTRRYAQVHYIPDREGDTVQGFFVMAFDIDQLKSATAAAQAASIAKSEFLANMSHEIRTPMNGVVGMADILQQSELLPAQRQMVDTIRDSALALLGILNDILDVSKIEAGKLKVESIPTALRGTVDGVLQLMLNDASARNVQVGVCIEPDVPAWILSDPTRLRQILMNLLGNAIKFTSGRAEQPAKVSLQVRRCRFDDDRPGLRFDVVDNGIGMSEHTIASLFQPFTQASESTARNFGGTGLGLNITQRLVGLMQGRIRVNSRLGEGSTFTVELPLLESQPGLAAAQEPMPAPLRTARPTVAQALADRRLILLAEDNQINSHVMCEQLGLIGYAAEVAGDGEVALQMWRSGRYALLLTDCHMPRMDGFELMAAIRQAEPPGTHLPIVAVTANAMQGEAERCLQQGFDAYLSKPLRLNELAALLARWLPQRQPLPVDPVEPAPPAATLPIWDAAALTRLIGRKPAVQRSVLNKFLLDTQTRITAIEQARAAGRVDAIAFDAHALKSAAATVGAMALSELCEELEHAGKAGSQDGCDRLAQPLREAFDAAAGLIRSATA